MEIESEQKALAFKDDHLVGIVEQSQIAHALGKHTAGLGQLDHVVIKVTQPLIFQKSVVPQAPLAAAVMKAPAVALSGEVDPLGMAEFIAHEVQIGLAATTEGKQADHLVQGNGTVNDHIMTFLVHVGVHIGVRKAEDHGLVAHQSLIMALHIGNRILTVTTQAHITPHLTDAPVLILLFLHGAHPHIGQAHGKAVVKAHAAVLNGQAHAGHTGHIFGNGDGFRIDLADQFIGKLQVGNGFGVGIQGEILVVVIEIGTQTVVVIQHGGHAVKAEPIKVILGHPEGQIGQQEVDHFILAVIKALGTPCRVVTLGAVMEELPCGAVEHIDAFCGILHSMGVHHIQQHAQTQLMGLVDQIFQVLRLTEPAGSGVKIGHLITKAAVIGVLHNGHQLNGIVTCFFDAGQHKLGKFAVGAHLALFLSHTHVGFVDVQGLRRLEILIGPVEDLPVIDHFGTPGNLSFFLNHAAGIQGDVVGTLQIGVHNSLDLAAVPKGVVPLQIQLPNAVIQSFQRV